MRIKRHQDVTPAVLKVMQQTKNQRLREILLAAVSHLHAFIREVRLTEEEFREAAALLAELGHRTTDNYNETVLMAGSLGISCWSACSTTATAAPPRPRRICSARSGG